MSYTCSNSACQPTDETTRGQFRQLQMTLNRFARGLKGERKIFDTLALDGTINPATYLAAKLVHKLLEYDLNAARKVEAATVSPEAIANNAAYLAREFAGWADVYGLEDPYEVVARRDPPKPAAAPAASPTASSPPVAVPAVTPAAPSKVTGKLVFLAGLGLASLGLLGYTLFSRRI